jgi:transposase-like protein
MARGKRHDDQTRAAVMAALLAGQGAEEVAETYNLPASTVYQWQQQARMGYELVRSEKSGSGIGDLIAAYLTQALTTVHVQAEHFSDKAWLGKQNAADAAVLHGVIMDKLVRLLEAAERADQSEDAGVEVP